MRAAGWVVLWVAASCALAGDGPRLDLEEDKRIALINLPAVLADEAVEAKLHTGLTTTFIFRVTAPAAGGGKTRGGARLEIRYELWDEVFHVTRLDGSGELGRETIATEEELAEWWGQLRLFVLDGREVRVDADHAQVVLDVLPFSRSEELDTQRWFSESVRRAEHEPDGEGVRSPSGQGNSMEQVFGLLIATSIRRRPVRSYDWTLDLPARGAPP